MRLIEAVLYNRMTEVDRRIHAPFYDEPFLKWYEGIFDSVFIALHPFFVIDGVDPSNAERRVQYVERAGIPGELTLEKVNEAAEEKRKTFDVDFKSIQTLQKQKGVKKTWNEVKTACGFSSLSLLNRALKTLILALRPEFASPDAAEHLSSLCTANLIFLPDENVFPPILENSISDLLNLLSATKVVCADEFEHYKTLVLTNDLRTESPWIQSGLLTFDPMRIYPEDHSFLITASFDNFYTAICGKRSALESIRLSELFEGFFCDAETRPEWWSEGPIF